MAGEFSTLGGLPELAELFSIRRPALPSAGILSDKLPAEGKAELRMKRTLIDQANRRLASNCSLRPQCHGSEPTCDQRAQPLQ